MNLATEKQGLGAFNKTLNNGPGTMIGNWWEERELREATGVGRTQPTQHIPKKHDELFSKTPEELSSTLVNRGIDNTNERALGAKVASRFNSTNYEYGKSRNPADAFPTTSKKHDLLEKMYLQKIEAELKEKEIQETQQAATRTFDTTHRAEYTPKELFHNSVGRRVMKDQNGVFVPRDRRDEDMLADFGALHRPKLHTDKELIGMMNNEHYAVDKPITFYTEKAKDGTFYMSPPTNEQNTFGKNNTFLKTFHQYTHTKC